MGKLHIVLGTALVLVLAIAVATQADEVPDHVYTALGNHFYKQGDLDRAVALYEHSDDHRAEHNLGLIAYEAGDGETAERHFREALETKPDYAHAWDSLGILLFELGRLEEAGDAFRMALQYESNNPQIHYDLAISIANNVRDGNGEVAELEEAIVHFARAEELDPGYAHATNNIEVLQGILN